MSFGLSFHQPLPDDPRLSCNSRLGVRVPPPAPNRWVDPVGAEGAGVERAGDDSQNGEKSWKTAWFGS
jgi:hypothetical protein